ncbi:unnamed protein product [Miscanthus lutarioriparius]|uniref:Uncharacterized protein n=1 Tax=Miscanthus lutarioriparius TaxID=422564 RepID=A0A811R125_9POAL|nr:unnamed protein product [Miscanthus lutarioriparius]
MAACTSTTQAEFGWTLMENHFKLMEEVSCMIRGPRPVSGMGRIRMALQSSQQGSRQDSVGEAKSLGGMLEVMVYWYGKKIDWAVLRRVTWPKGGRSGKCIVPVISILSYPVDIHTSGGVLKVDIIGLSCYSLKDLWTRKNKGLVLCGEEKNAYLIYSSEDNSELHIGPLTDDYLDVTDVMQRFLIAQHQEAPALFKHEGTFMVTSGCTSWAPNTVLSHMATSVMDLGRHWGTLV